MLNMTRRHIDTNALFATITIVKTSLNPGPKPLLATNLYLQATL